MGSFNVILYTKKGRHEVIRRLPLSVAINRATEWSMHESGWQFGAVRRISDGKLVGDAMRGQFIFAP